MNPEQFKEAMTNLVRGVMDAAYAEFKANPGVEQWKTLKMAMYSFQDIQKHDPATLWEQLKTVPIGEITFTLFKRLAVDRDAALTF